MLLELKAMFHDAVEHVHRLVTQPVEELRGAQRSIRYLIDLFRHCARQLREHRAEEMAAALTYRTIFSLIPLCVLALIVFRTFGGFEEVQTKLQQGLYEFFGVPEVSYADEAATPEPGEQVVIEVPNPKAELEKQKQENAEETGTAAEQASRQENSNNQRQVRASIQKALTELTLKVANLDFASIGIVGVIVFIYAAMALAVSMEHDFNIVFDSPRGRPWHLRIAIYWSLITLGSGLLAVSLYLSGQVVQWVENLHVFMVIVWLLHHLLAYLASWVLLFLLYSLMPNTRVKIRPALIGSFVAALLWEFGKAGFQIYVASANPYNNLYGSLGLIPLFLFWVYISWVVVLFGLELASTLQNMHGKVPAKTEEEPPHKLIGDPDWFIPMLLQIGRSFIDGKPLARQELSERLSLSTRIISDFGQELEHAGMIHCINCEGDAGYTLARPPDRIHIGEVLELGRQLSRSHIRGTAAPDWRYLDKLYEAQREAVHGVTLAELINTTTVGWNARLGAAPSPAHPK